MSGFQGSLGSADHAFPIQSELLSAIRQRPGGTGAKEPEQVPRSRISARFKGKSVVAPALDAVATDVSVGAKLHINL